MRDLQRTFYSFRKQYLTLRIPNSLTKDPKTLKKTINYIAKFLDASIEQLDDDDEWDLFGWG